MTNTACLPECMIYESQDIPASISGVIHSRLCPNGPRAPQAEASKVARKVESVEATPYRLNSTHEAEQRVREVLVRVLDIIEGDDARDKNLVRLRPNVRTKFIAGRIRDEFSVILRAREPKEGGR